MRLKVNVNTKEFLKGINILLREYPTAANKVLKELAGESQKQIIFRYVPVKTGNLRSTVRVDTSKGIAVVAGGIQGKGKPDLFVDYAKHVNDGTSRIAPRRYMEKGVAAALNRTDSISHQILDSWLKGAGYSN